MQATGSSSPFANESGKWNSRKTRQDTDTDLQEHKSHFTIDTMPKLVNVHNLKQMGPMATHKTHIGTKSMPHHNKFYQ